MKFTTEWLLDWVALPPSTAALVERLTMGGLEVDRVEPAAGPLEGVIAARIVATRPHPQAERLQICTVATGSGAPVEVVCGAANARAGLLACFAAPGVRLPDGRVIGHTTIRGVASAGMLCSAAELGLGDDASGLLELPADAPIGADLSSCLHLADTIIDIDLTPNRGDCLSMLGLAREIGALTDAAVRPADIAPVAAQCQDRFRIEIAATAACPRYVGRVIRGVDAAAASPIWLKERLRRCGIRAINVVVDVTNYVMLELGQPMHVFDRAKLRDGIVVRQARAGETLLLLDGQQLSLDAETLVIADSRQAVAIAGVMGGSETGVGTTTRDVLLESAYFDPVLLAGVARRYKLHTDAAHRFERGVDPAGQARAIERATALLAQCCGGTAGPTLVVEERSALPPPRRIVFRPERAVSVLGLEVSTDEMLNIFRRLELEVDYSSKNWTVAVPGFRFDLSREVDLIEELARIKGYACIPATIPVAPLNLSPGAIRPGPQVARTALVARGYFEAITYSFIAPALGELFAPDSAPIELANPISQDMSVMRPSLLPGLLLAARHNLNRQQAAVRLFELGMVFQQREGALRQDTMLGGITLGDLQPEQWGSPPRAADYYDVKQDIIALFKSTGAGECEFLEARHPALHPSQSAAIGKQGEVVGHLGALHPRICRALDLAGAPVVFEMALRALAPRPPPAFRPLSKFPAVRRDISVVVDAGVPAETVLASIRAAAGEMLRDLQLFDVYQGQGIDSGKKSLALGLIFQASSSTLIEEQIDATVATVLERLKGDVGGALRT